MIIQLNIDKSIPGNEKFESYLDTLIKKELSRFADHITRIEVHLSDQNGSKGNEKRCMLEARLEHKQPIAVISHGHTVEQAVNDALDELWISIERMLKESFIERIAEIALQRMQ